MNFVERLAGQQLDDYLWRFDLGEELNGAFGGTNGGILAAICVYVARAAAPGRRAASVDARFIRGFRPGAARVQATVLNAGRTLSSISVDIFNAEDKLATRGTVSLVAPEALARIAWQEAEPVDTSSFADLAEAKLWRQPRGQRPIPLIDTFEPRHLGRGEGGTATATRVIWDDAAAVAEAACVAADISVGPTVLRALAGKPLAIPNPDLSLRFSGAAASSRELLSICRLESLLGGLAMTSIRVSCGPDLLAVGVSTTTCLGI